MELLQITQTFAIDINEVVGVNWKDGLKLRLRDGTEKQVSPEYVELVKLKLDLDKVVDETNNDLEVLKRIDAFRQWLVFEVNAEAKEAEIQAKMIELLSIKPRHGSLCLHDFEIYRDEGILYNLWYSGDYPFSWRLHIYLIENGKEEFDGVISIKEDFDGKWVGGLQP
jgi:hypothetical protein